MGRGDVEIIREESLERFEDEVSATLRRKSPNEAKLAGALRVLAPHSPAVRDLLARAGAELAQRRAFDRDLFGGALRALVESVDGRASSLLRSALVDPAGATLPALSAACFTGDARLSGPLAKLSAHSRTHIAFAAELARVVRGEAQGAWLASLALKLKESYRVALCTEAFLPLARGSESLPPALGEALRVLLDAERHLGRWLVFAELATRLGERGPLATARALSTEAPPSARGAWALAGWALDPEGFLPSTRPSMALVVRLSDRPSASKDTGFLFRMAEAKLPTAVPMLEALTGGGALGDPLGIRAAMHLARDYGQISFRDALLAASSSIQDELRGIASAALFDLGEPEAACRAAGSLTKSRLLGSLSWSALVLSAAAGSIETSVPVLREPTYRGLQHGWL